MGLCNNCNNVLPSFLRFIDEHITKGKGKKEI